MKMECNALHQHGQVLGDCTFLPIACLVSMMAQANICQGAQTF